MEAKMGTGDLRMEDVLSLDKSKAMNLFRNRFERYKTLAEEMGDEAAFEKMMEKYPEQQKMLMGALIDNNTLANGLKKSIPMFRLMGFITDFVDISHNGTDAVLEIQRVCPASSLAKEYGFESPCRVLCEMEQEAARRAFPGLKAEILSKRAEGSSVCLFTYERLAQPGMESINQSNFLSKIATLSQLVSMLFQVSIKMLKMRFSNKSK